MRTLDPYVEIEKVPLYTTDRMKSRGYSIRVEDNQSKSGWNEVGVVSEDYLLVPNRQVRDMALEIADRSGMRWDETKVFFDGKRFMYGLTARNKVQAEVKVGDALGLGMLFENSYDGSRRLGASLYVNRLACTNGMLIPQYFARMRFRHDSSGSGWEDEVHRALSMFDGAEAGLQRFADAGRVLAKMRLGSPELKEIRSRVWDRLPTTLWGKIMDQYLNNEELSGWGLLNAGTNVCWHNEKGTIQDFSHNEYLTAGLIGYATDHFPTHLLN